MPTDQKTIWLGTIWREVHALMHADGYFRLWVKAQEAAKIPYGPISQTIINGYATYQLAAIRRICDRRKADDVVSLPKILELIKQEQPHRQTVIDSLLTRLKTECDELYNLATQYVAHNADPQTTRNWKAWGLTSDKITMAQKAICEVFIIIERDLLSVTQRGCLIAVYQGDYLAEVRPLVPEDQLEGLREFWHAHNKSINQWVQVPRLF
jgi:hypothetical protein